MKKEKAFDQKELHELSSIIKEKTGYCIRSKCLLLQAFTRSSYSTENGGENNEMLEFIGDQVLDYYVVKLTAERFGALDQNCEYRFRVRENHLSSLKQELVSNDTLARIIDEWNIAKYLIVGKSDYMNAVDEQIKVKADLFEAILGAIAVECKWDTCVLEKAVKKSLSLDERIKNVIETEYRPAFLDIENAVTALKELAEHGGCSHPKYDEFLTHDKDGNPWWGCVCVAIFDETGYPYCVWASSKKAAKKAAAYLVLCAHYELQNEYGPNGRYKSWIYKDGKLTPGNI